MMKFLRLLFTVVPKILHAFIWHIWGYARHPEKTPIEERYRVVRKLLITICNEFHCDFNIEGLERIRELEKEGQCFLLTPNHLSDLDPLVVVYFCEKPITFVGKIEITEFPFVRSIMRALDGLFIDRDDLKQNVRIMKEVREKIGSGTCSVCIFPEGTRNKTPENDLLPYHAGTFKPATRVKAPIVPVTLYGTQRPFKKSINWKRYPINIYIHKPLTPADYKGYKTPDICDYVYKNSLEQYYKYRDVIDASYIEEEKQKIPYKKGLNDKYLIKID